MNLAVGIMQIVEGNLIEDGMLSVGGLNLSCCLMMLALLLILGAKRIHDRRMEDEA